MRFLLFSLIVPQQQCSAVLALAPALCLPSIVPQVPQKLALPVCPRSHPGFEADTSGRKRYNRDFLFYYGNRCHEVPKGIEDETFQQLSRANMPPMPHMGGGGGRGGGRGEGGRGGRGGGGFDGGDERWQSGRMPSGESPARCLLANKTL
jgi:hypothetical protein